MGKYRTPLRYPGGKQRLTPFIEEILASNKITNGNYVEPFAGGAGVAIQLLLSGKVDLIHLNDSDYRIYAFWYSILNKAEEFCHLIRTASLTIDEWRKQRDIVKKCDRRKLLSLGFSVFYLNRCNRSGILSGGVIGGNDQKGNYKMDARFSRNDLIRRIEAIALVRDKVSLTQFDAEYYIRHYVAALPKNTLVYLDPPYYEKGSKLYHNFYGKTDHARLAQVIQSSLKHKWILSYDCVPEVLGFYQKRRHFFYGLQYNASSVYKGREVFILGDSVKLPSESSLDHVNKGIQAYTRKSLTSRA
ncbi:MAG: DNA adenine methylase [Bacteroidota bacterium]|nr:DNA adenine methylase [Bacteroidota bacterium]MDP4236600.1 DNA adenine methylase [Bacteroidota bacterium]